MNARFALAAIPLLVGAWVYSAHAQGTTYQVTPNPSWPYGNGGYTINNGPGQPTTTMTPNPSWPYGGGGYTIHTDQANPRRR